MGSAEIEKLCAEMKEVAIANCKNDAQRQAVKNVTKNVLLSWGILAEDESGKLRPTNAWVFLNGQDAFLSRIQCGMFKGTTRTIFVDKRDYEGPLWKQIDNAFQFVLRNIHLGARIEGIYRKDIYELPPDSVRELIINSVMNCSFLQPSHIQVAIYDDRLEITSPGGLMPGVTIDRMKEGYSQIRNRALAHAFSYMNLIEGWGTGIPRLLREMREYGLAEPEFIDMEVALRINLYRGRTGGETNQENAQDIETSQETNQENAQDIETSQETNQENAPNIETSQETMHMNKAGGKVRREYLCGLNSREAIIWEIKKNPSVTQVKLGEKTGLSRSGVRYVLKQLQEEGIVERVGSTKKGQWIIKES